MSGRAISSANGKSTKGLDAIGPLITSSIIPQLHELAQRMVAAGHHQECCKIYRYSKTSCTPVIIGVIGGNTLIVFMRRL
jgi:hypothetical protein